MNGNINGNLAYEMEPEEEIIGGEVVMMAPATLNHNRIVRNISRIFETYLQGRTCEYFTDGASLYLEEDAEEYKPDGMVVCDPDKTKGDSGVYASPDLALEILSPSTAQNDRGRKKDVYEKHGVREYWIVDPLSLQLFRPENGDFPNLPVGRTGSRKTGNPNFSASFKRPDRRGGFGRPGDGLENLPLAIRFEIC